MNICYIVAILCKTRSEHTRQGEVEVTRKVRVNTPVGDVRKTTRRASQMVSAYWPHDTQVRTVLVREAEFDEKGADSVFDESKKSWV